MRAFFFLLLSLVPLPALADTVTLPSAATAATLFRSGALVTHDVTVNLPEGAHQIILPDLPPDLALSDIRVSAAELTVGALRYRADLAPPRRSAEDADVFAARARIAELEAQIEAVEDRAAQALLPAEAAEARAEFLAGLGRAPGLPRGPDALRALADMIAAETLAAKQAAFEAERAARQIRTELVPLEAAREQAERALAALVPEPQERPILVLDVFAAQAVTDSPISVSFMSAQASWSPSYDLRLQTEPTPLLAIARGARITQNVGENWENVALTVSTQDLARALEPAHLPPDLRRIFDEDEFVTLRAAPVATADMAFESAPQMEMITNGVALSYRWPGPVSVASGADALRLPFDTLTFEPEISARAVPLFDDHAFLVAHFTNTSGAPLLPSADVLRYVDGGLVGAGNLPLIVDGESAEIGFGALDGLQLTRQVLAREEGDRGILNRSNEKTEEVEITMRNLTAQRWQVELRDRVPYSEQEDLEITYSAIPEPSSAAVDGKRGVLQWDLPLEPGEETQVTTSHRIVWPEGARLR